MAISYVGAATATNSAGGASYSLDLSALSLAEGDLVIVWYGWSSFNPNAPSTTPSGYTAITAGLTAADSTDTNARPAYKFMGASPDTSIPDVPAPGNTVDGAVAIALAFRGVDPTTPLDGVTPTTASAANSSLANPPAITPATSGAWVVGFYAGGRDTTPSDMNTPSNMTGGTQATKAGSGRGFAAGQYYYSGWSSGSFNPAAWTSDEDSVTLAWVAATCVLRPDTSQDITPSGPTIAVTPGTLTVTAAQDVTPSGPSVSVSPGTLTVSNTQQAVSPSGPTIAVSPGTLTVTPPPQDVTPTGPTISITPGTLVVTTVTPITPSGPTITVTPGSVTVTPGAAPISPTGPTITITPGTLTVGQNQPVTPVGATITITPGSLTVAFPPYVPLTITAPDARRWSGSELLDLPAGLGQRIETVVFQILNYDLTYVFTATQLDRGSPPTMHFDANSATNRTLSGLRFGPEDAARIDPLRHLVRPLWGLDDGSTWPLGVFHFSDTPIDLFSWGIEFTPECFDRSVMLNQARASTFSIPQGTLYTTAARQIIDEVGLTSWAAIDNSSAYATSPQTFNSGTTRKAILAAICEALGFYPPYFDNDGFLRLRAVPNPISDAQPDVVYTADESSRIIRDSTKISSNILDAPNVYRVVGDPAAGEVVGEYRVPDSAPHSVAHRGLEIVRVIDNQSVQDQAAAVAAAQAAYVNDFSTHVEVEFESAPDPRSDGMQIVNFLGTNYREQSWDLVLAPGGRMRHKVQEVWQP